MLHSFFRMLTMWRDFESGRYAKSRSRVISDSLTTTYTLEIAHFKTTAYSCNAHRKKGIE